MPMAKARRQHLHNMIDRNKLDTTHTTHRTGSPHVLVCTKTAESWKQACHVYEQNLKHLAEVNRIMEGRRNKTIPRKPKK